MQERIYFWIGVTLALVGLGMPMAFPHSPAWIGYGILSAGVLCGLYALSLWRGHSKEPVKDSQAKNQLNIKGHQNTLSNVKVGDN